MNKKQTYLFDFDGTIVDSMPTFVSVMLKILDEYGIEYGADIVKIITPLGYLGTAQYYQTLGINEKTSDLVAKMKNYALYEYENTIIAKDGVVDTLKSLKANGDSLNVLTASPHEMLDSCLKRVGMWELFDNVWSCDDFNTSKSNPEIYKMAACKLGKKVEDVIFIDDNVNAVKTAKTAGMQSFGIYDESSKDYVEQMKSVSDRYLENLADLLK